MMTFPKILTPTIAGLALLWCGTALAQVDPPAMAWEVLPDKSSIEWTAVYSGKPISGSFSNFTSDIHFDPAKLGSSNVEVKIDTSKITSDDKDAEQALPGGEWFNASVFPHAVFEAKTFTHVSDEQYRAEGTLRIGEKTNPIILPFSVHFYQDSESSPAVHYAQMTAETAIKRSEYGLGKGDWSKTDIVLDDVKVTINIKAKEAAQTTPAKP
jgi:polyisoprenoid-binding protein YceI